jgi:replication factor C subunit 2/4
VCGGQVVVQSCLEGNIDQACASLDELCTQGYSPLDIITTLFRVVKTYPMPEHVKLEFIRVRHARVPWSCV